MMRFNGRIRISAGAMAIVVVLLAQLIAGAFWAGGISSDVGSLDDRMARMESQLEQLVRPAITGVQK